MSDKILCDLLDIVMRLGYPGEHQYRCIVLWYTLPHAKKLLELISHHYDFSSPKSKTARIYRTIIEEYLKTLDDAAKDELAEAVHACTNCKHVRQGCLNWQVIMTAVNMVLAYHVMCHSRFNPDRNTF